MAQRARRQYHGWRGKAEVCIRFAFYRDNSSINTCRPLDLQKCFSEETGTQAGGGAPARLACAKYAVLPRRIESDRARSSLTLGLVHATPHHTTRADIPQLTSRLSRLEGMYIRQATEAARISNRAENARLHYSEVKHKRSCWGISLLYTLTKHSLPKAGPRIWMLWDFHLTKRWRTYVHASRTVSSDPRSSPRHPRLPC